MSARQRRHKRERFRTCAVERLESRELLSASAAVQLAAYPTLELRASKKGAVAADSSGPQGFTPAQIWTAYGFNQLASFPNNSNGRGQTIAIVDSYGDPNIQSDLQTFDAQFSLPAPPSFQVVPLGNMSQVPLVQVQGWATEVALDVEWAHAVAPGANILLIETQSSNLLESEDVIEGPGLLDGVQYATEQRGVSVVSMSWTAPEFAGENSFDSYFTPTSVNPGITFVTAGGDSGPPANWPASSPNVLAVGGTTLATDASGDYHSEIGWVGSGGGVSLYEAEPSYQYSVQNTGVRTTPDVSYDGDPNTGFSVYCSYQSGGDNWQDVGGTSAGTPQWAGIIAIANQGRAASGKAALESATADIYQLPAADFHDVTSGFNGYAATPGYDLVSGRGTPYVNRIVPGLLKAANPPATSTATVSAAAEARLKSALATAARIHVHGTAEADVSAATPAGAATSGSSPTDRRLAAASFGASAAEPQTLGLDQEEIAAPAGLAAPAESQAWPLRQEASLAALLAAAPLDSGDADSFDALGPSAVDAAPRHGNPLSV
jgi:subtilase family serine protease